MFSQISSAATSSPHNYLRDSLLEAKSGTSRGIPFASWIALLLAENDQRATVAALQLLHHYGKSDRLNRVSRELIEAVLLHDRLFDQARARPGDRAATSTGPRSRGCSTGTPGEKAGVRQEADRQHGARQRGAVSIRAFLYPAIVEPDRQRDACRGLENCHAVPRAPN